MRKAFLEYLAAEGCVPSDRLEQIQSLLRGAPGPMGLIAFSYGMISGADIDAILDEQRANYRPFGAIAVDRGLLTQGQVEALLSVQRIRAAVETAEALTLSGICPTEHVMTHLGRFLIQQQNAAVCTSS